MATDNHLKNYYEQTAHRFWDASAGPSGRDLVIFPLLNGLQGSLLEYGCGAGSLLLHLTKEDRFQQVYGVDISENALSNVRAAWAQCAAHKQDKLRLYQPDNDFLPFIADKSIDVIVSVATIEHVLNPYIVLDELFRIAKPGGTLICSVPNYGYIKHRLSLLAGELPRTGTDEPVEKWRQAGWDGMHLHTFTQSAFSILLNDCGWAPTKWTGWGTRFGWMGRLRQWYPGLLSGEIIAVCRKKVEAQIE
jgi:SAM-dependent methyltransferase